MIKLRAEKWILNYLHVSNIIIIIIMVLFYLFIQYYAVLKEISIQ